MADRQIEKKESKSDDKDNWIPVVTPDQQRQSTKDQQQQEFNPKDYKANTKWIILYSFLGPTEPKPETTPTEINKNIETKICNR